MKTIDNKTRKEIIKAKSCYEKGYLVVALLARGGGGEKKLVEGTGMCRPYGWVFWPKIL